MHDPISTCTVEDGKIAEWISQSKASDVPRSDSDDVDDDKVFPTELIWRQIEVAMEMDPTQRSKSRVGASKKAKQLMPLRLPKENEGGLWPGRKKIYGHQIHRIRCQIWMPQIPKNWFLN